MRRVTAGNKGRRGRKTAARERSRAEEGVGSWSSEVTGTARKAVARRKRGIGGEPLGAERVVRSQKGSGRERGKGKSEEGGV